MQKERCFKDVVENNFIAPLYPGLQISGMTNGAGYKFGFSCSVIPQCRNAGYSKRNQSGFTLIELLVVVLIIGILAAVALPQYQKAVEKSRATQAFSLLKSISQAAQTYYLANGVWPTKFEELDVEIPWTGNQKWHNSPGVRDTKSNGEWSAQIYSVSPGDYVMFWLGRISGPYAGAGLAATSRRDFQILCVEDANANNLTPFSLDNGMYCQKIMRGTFAWGAGDVDYYTLP